MKSKSVNNPIIEAFWVAEYFDGQSLPQFDTINKRENSYSYINHKNVKRFWWIPITPDMTGIFPFTRYNPLLKRHYVELNGSKGFVARRTSISLNTKIKIPIQKIDCYVIGIEGGSRIEIYPNGTVINKTTPTDGETQYLLHG